MAISLVGTAGGGRADNGNITITLPVGTTTNDLVRVFGGADARFSSQGGAVGISTAGYTELARIDGLTFVTCALFEKVMGGSPDTEVVCTGPGVGGAYGLHYLVRVYRDIDTTTPSDATPVETSSDNVSSPPDNGSITTATDGAWVEAYVYHTTDETDETFTAPTGYTDKTEGFTAGSAIAANVAGATKLVATAGAENPSSWGGTTGNIWACITGGVRPAAAAAGGATSNMLLLGVG